MRPLALLLLLTACSADATGLQTKAGDAAPDIQQVITTWPTVEVKTDAQQPLPDLAPVVGAPSAPDVRPSAPDVSPDIVASPDLRQPLAPDTRTMPSTSTNTGTATNTATITQSATETDTGTLTITITGSVTSTSTATSTSTSTSTWRDTATYTSTVTITRTRTETYKSTTAGTAPKTSIVTSTNTYTKTVTATSTSIDPHCTNDAPIAPGSSVYNGTCSSYAEDGYCATNTYGYNNCNAACLRCNAGCVDLQPSGNLNGAFYKNEAVKDPEEFPADCWLWMENGNCNDDVMNPYHFFCRKTCGFCAQWKTP
jgi:hypothetical protein